MIDCCDARSKKFYLFWKEEMRSYFSSTDTLSTYDDVVGHVIRESEVRPVYGRQGTKVSGSRILRMDLNKVVVKECSDYD